jgi:CheY-like chemotaxis protein
VDDEIDSAEVVRRILQRSGATVRTAGSMIEALSILEAFAADVIVSDIVNARARRLRVDRTNSRPAEWT